MTPIETNKHVFFGDNGRVLQNGYIYIGIANQDPVSNPKTVTFQDPGGSQFAAEQPLRTGSDGRIVNPATGKPVIALVDGDYSMLVQNSSGAQIKNGYTPLIENSTTSAATSQITYANILVDLKAINVTPGQYVENIGKTSELDGEGARWLVVSNTGNPADDVDLIDFDNGTQGQRVENQLYALKNLQEIEDAGSGAQVEAQGNLNLTDLQFIADAGSTSQDAALANIGVTTFVKSLDNDFSAGTMKGIKIGDLVVIYFYNLGTFAGGGNSTSSGFVPSDFRPTATGTSNSCLFYVDAVPTNGYAEITTGGVASIRTGTSGSISGKTADNFSLSYLLT